MRSSSLRQDASGRRGRDLQQARQRASAAPARRETLDMECRLHAPRWPSPADHSRHARPGHRSRDRAGCRCRRRIWVRSDRRRVLLRRGCRRRAAPLSAVSDIFKRSDGKSEPDPRDCRRSLRPRARSLLSVGSATDQRGGAARPRAGMERRAIARREATRELAGQRWRLRAVARGRVAATGKIERPHRQTRRPGGRSGSQEVAQALVAPARPGCGSKPGEQVAGTIACRRARCANKPESPAVSRRLRSRGATFGPAVSGSNAERRRNFALRGSAATNPSMYPLKELKHQR